MRTPEDFVSQMLKAKRHWSSILAVARQIRGGRWRDEVKEILRAKGLIPTDHLEEIRQRDKIIEAQRASKAKKELAHRSHRPRKNTRT